MKKLNLNSNKGLGDEGVAATVQGLAVGGVALEMLCLSETNAGPKAAVALVKWLGVEGVSKSLQTLYLRGNAGLGADELALIIEGFMAGRVPIPVDYGTDCFYMFGINSAGPKAAAELGKWLEVKGAAANLTALELNGNEGRGDEGVAAIVNGLAASGASLESLVLNNTNAGSKAAAAHRMVS